MHCHILVLLAAFVKLTPKQILETNIYHTENPERELTDYFNFVSPTHILQALLITKKFNPITALLPPSIDKVEGCFPVTVRFLLHFKKSVVRKKTTHSYERNAYYFICVCKLLWYTCIIFLLLPQITSRVY